MRLEFQDSIDRYLLNRMSDEERTAFEAKCTDNLELREQLEHTRDVKTVISEKSKMLDKIQAWDEEYEEEKRIAAKKKRIAIYCSSSIAAAFVVGYFLFSTANSTDSESFGNLVSMNQGNDDLSAFNCTVDSVSKTNEDNDMLLAQNDAVNKIQDKVVSPSDKEQVYSFGNENLETASPREINDYEKELHQIESELEIINKKISEISSQFNSGSINQDVYDSIVNLLYHQKEFLSWKEAQFLLILERKEEAFVILDELRHSDGEYKHKADSLYRLLWQNE